MTDPARVRRTDPGTPEVCNIFDLHRHFSAPDTVETVAAKCRSAGWGCLDCKRVLADRIIEALTPIRERTEILRETPSAVDEIIADGADRAVVLARETLDEVKSRMGFLPRKEG